MCTLPSNVLECFVRKLFFNKSFKGLQLHFLTFTFCLDGNLAVTFLWVQWTDCSQKCNFKVVFTCSWLSCLAWPANVSRRVWGTVNPVAVRMGLHEYSIKSHELNRLLMTSKTLTRLVCSSACVKEDAMCWAFGIVGEYSDRFCKVLLS